MIFILLLVALVSLIVSLGLFIDGETNGTGETLLSCAATFLIFAISSIWVIKAVNDDTPYQYENEYICPIQNVVLDNKTVQEVQYRHNGYLQTVNITNILNGYIDPAKKVKVKVNGSRTAYWVTLYCERDIEVMP